MIMKACRIIHSMVVEKRKPLYVGNGIGGLRGTKANDGSDIAFVPLNLAAQASLVDRIRFRHTIADDIKCVEKHQRLLGALVSYIYVGNIIMEME